MELISIGPKDVAEVKCIVTLEQDLLGSEITVTNPRSLPLQLLGSLISHLTVSTPDATYALGLQGSSYHNKQPMVSEFTIIPPSLREKALMLSVNPWAQKGFDALFSSWDKRIQVQNKEWEEEKEEDDDYAQMTEKMSRIYTSAPREFTVMDRVIISFKKFSSFLSEQILIFQCDDVM